MKRDQSGFSLVELVVIVATIGTLLAIATLHFSRMNEKYRVESNIKEIYTILMRARNDAMATNIRHQVDLAANQLQFGRDANNDGNIDTPATIPFPNFTINFAANTIAFDRRGLTNNIQTIRITGYPAGVTPLMDCITVANTRINMGRMNGANCDQL